ncbi:hypothetical protein CCHR01_11971 [Colletotrichum chrysophilum]|uniref:Uncharacterized protein n=1 Tax=Colletotrichum chrysophilum TaxID=1836956 RepID=A0AAD9AC70_9PEZI|nr:hypothetical protein CCHR01_11971 [Colletotrichum chrysophilum]
MPGVISPDRQDSFTSIFHPNPQRSALSVMLRVSSVAVGDADSCQCPWRVFLAACCLRLQ